MTINWKFISYLLVFLAGEDWEKYHHFLCFILLTLALGSYWLTKHGNLSSDREIT